MVHQEFQEALEQLSVKEGMDSEELKKHFNLSKEDVMAMEITPLMETSAPRPTSFCCCCMQSDN